VQRAYRDRLKTAGKAVKLVDADWDSDKFRALFAKIRDDLHNALSKIELREQDVARLEARNVFLENELVRLERELTGAAKDRIVARRQARSRVPR
jgi:hypothetical protein